MHAGNTTGTESFSTSMFVSLARKYRPKTFADVAVQSHVSNTLRSAVARSRVAHGYLLCGPRGVGKTTLARVLAMALNCERRGKTAVEGEPCGECDSCRRIWSGAASLDVVEIDAASNRGVDDARELRERAMYAPSSDAHYKVYIVDEAHMLTREAWNALLKILEEPPSRVVFVFATTEPQKIAQTAAPVLSRLQRFDLKRIGAADIRARLETVLGAEGVSWTDEALGAVARAADGSMRDALSIADQVLSLGDGQLTLERVREALGLVAEDEYLAVLDLVAEHRAADVFPLVARLVDSGADLGGFLGGLAEMFRAELSLALGGAAEGVSERARAALTARRGRFSSGDLVRMLQAMTEIEPRFRRSGQQQILVETLLVRFALLDRTVEIEEVLRELGTGGAAAVSGARPREAPRGGRSASGAGLLRSETPVSRADAPGEQPQRQAAMAPALDALVASWPEVVSQVRAAGRNVLAAALEHARPVSVGPAGEVALEVDGERAAYQPPIEVAAQEVLGAIRTYFAGAQSIVVRAAGGGAASVAGAPRRLTEDSVRSERLAMLRKRDPALDAAVETLDLELLD